MRTKCQWVAWVSLAWVVAGVLLLLRSTFIGRILHLSAFDWVPLTGDVNGWNPHFFLRLMQDLTHPLVLLCYATAMTILTIRSLKPPAGRSGTFVRLGIEILHFVYLGSYLLASLCFPICTMREIIAP